MDQGRKNKSIRSSSFTCVYCRFRVRQCSSSAFLVIWCPFYPLISFGHAQNLERTPQDKSFRCLYVMSCARHTFCSELVRSSSCYCQLLLNEQRLRGRMNSNFEQKKNSCLRCRLRRCNALMAGYGADKKRMKRTNTWQEQDKNRKNITVQSVPK